LVEYLVANEVSWVRFPDSAFKMKKCPVCNSSKISENEKGEKECKKCGYAHSKRKSAKIIEEFDNLSKE
jgi:transposase-like protein